MPRTTGKDVPKKGDREKELIGHAVRVHRSMIECPYCERQGALHWTGNRPMCRNCGRQSPRRSARRLLNKLLGEGRMEKTAANVEQEKTRTIYKRTRGIQKSKTWRE